MVVAVLLSPKLYLIISASKETKISTRILTVHYQHYFWQWTNHFSTSFWLRGRFRIKLNEKRIIMCKAILQRH